MRKNHFKMQDIINELTAGSVEYKEDGSIVHRPPNSLQLRAARTLTEVFNINQTNTLLVNQMQAHINDLFKINNSLKAELDAIRTTQRESSSIESVREGERKTSSVECGDAGLRTSDSNGEESGTNSNVITGTN